MICGTNKKHRKLIQNYPEMQNDLTYNIMYASRKCAFKGLKHHSARAQVLPHTNLNDEKQLILEIMQIKWCEKI